MSKGMKFRTLKNRMPEIRKSLEAVNEKRVEVGVFDGEHAWLAGIHEYGMTIRAKRAEYLTVPLCPEAAGKEARSFEDTWVYTSKKGNKFIVQGKEMKFLYWLTKSVVIPERSFLRAGFDENVDKVNKAVERLMNSFLKGSLSEDDFLKAVGQTMAGRIRTYARDLSSPGNSAITAGNKGSENPLVDTGQMIESITWRVDE